MTYEHRPANPEPPLHVPTLPEDTPVLIGFNQMHGIARAHNLSFTRNVWDSLQQLPEEPELIIGREAGNRVSGRLNLTLLDSVLRENYTNRPPNKWSGISTSTLTTLHLISGALVPPSVLNLPEARPSTTTSPELGDRIVPDAQCITDFAHDMGLPANARRIRNSIMRLGAAGIEVDYPYHLSLFTPGEYEVDETRANLMYDKAEVVDLSLASLASRIRNAKAVVAAKTHPGTHYILTRYFNSLAAQGIVPEPETKHAPEHPLTGEAFKPTVVSATEAERLMSAGELSPLRDSLAKNDHEYYAIDAAKDLASVVKTYAKSDLYTPLSAVFCRVEGDDELLISRTATSALLKEYFTSGKPKRDWPVSYHIGHLLRFDTVMGSYEPELDKISEPEIASGLRELELAYKRDEKQQLPFKPYDPENGAAYWLQWNLYETAPEQIYRWSRLLKAHHQRLRPRG